MSQLRLLLMSTPVGHLGSGLGGGVELRLLNLGREMRRRGHGVTVLAPERSVLEEVPVVEIPGQPQITAHTQGRDAPIVLPGDSVLAAMWDYARQHQHQFDLIVNFAYDWLPFYLTPFFQTPVAHFVTMASLSDVIDGAVRQVAEQFPGRLGVSTRAQAQTFEGETAFRILGSAIDLSLYQFCPTPGDSLVWLGRISPEKGLEDALAATEMAQVPLKILGKLEDEAYWRSLCQRFPQAEASYLGFLPTQELQQVVGQCRAMVMTPRWVEAFGNVVVESMACGVPVITYDRGGPAEIVRHGETGWVVPPDDVAALAEAIGRIDDLDRSACRRQAEAEYSLVAMGDRFEAWFQNVVDAATAP
ncbi:MAG: glycosyltransferase family 4 protein [Spirulina sp.]